MAGPLRAGHATAPSFSRRSTRLSTSVVDAGYEPDPRATRASRRPTSAKLLREHDVDEVTVVGLATDYCVKHTALDALREGFR